MLVKGRWCSEAGKVTISLATHWPCVTDFVVYHLRARGIWEGDECLLTSQEHAVHLCILLSRNSCSQLFSFLFSALVVVENCHFGPESYWEDLEFGFENNNNSFIVYSSHKSNWIYSKRKLEYTHVKYYIQHICWNAKNAKKYMHVLCLQIEVIINFVEWRPYIIYYP